MLPLTGPLYPWQEYVGGYLIALDALVVFFIIGRIPKHSSSEKECFLTGLLLGIAACRMPLIVLLTIPVWGWLIYRNLFSLRAFLATLIGYATVAVWLFAVYLSPLSEEYPLRLSLLANLPFLIPVLSILLAWLLSAITRHLLRER